MEKEDWVNYGNYRSGMKGYEHKFIKRGNYVEKILTFAVAVQKQI